MENLPVILGMLFRQSLADHKSTSTSKQIRKHLHKQSAPKLLVVHGEVSSQPGKAVFSSGAAFCLDSSCVLLVFAAWAHSLLWLPAVCESRPVHPSP